QQMRLAPDLGGPLAIAAVGRAQILSFDDLGEAHDRVERSLDLMNELTHRIRVRQDVGHGVAAGRGGHRRSIAQRYAAVSGEAAVRRLKGRDSADLPFARDRPSSAHPQQRVAEWSAHGKGADDFGVDAVAVILFLPGKRAADQWTARRSLD